MGKAFTFEIKGLKELQKKFDVMPKQLVEEIDGELESSCQQIVLKAKQLAPVDKGALRQSIAFNGVNLSYVITETVRYAPYQEFGTGNKVSVPSEVSGYSPQFKGTGKRNVNIKPQPHLFPALFAERPKLLTNISNVIKRLEK